MVSGQGRGAIRLWGRWRGQTEPARVEQASSLSRCRVETPPDATVGCDVSPLDKLGVSGDAASLLLDMGGGLAHSRNFLALLYLTYPTVRVVRRHKELRHVIRAFRPALPR